MTVYLVYNTDPKYMYSFLMKVFSSREGAEEFRRNEKDVTHIQEWEVEK